MICALVSLSLYLLFPQIDDAQVRFEQALIKPALTDAQKFVEKQKLLSLISGLSDFFDTNEDGFADILDEPVSERLYVDSLSRLSLLQHGDEQLALTPLPDGTFESVTVNTDEVVRRAFDTAKRLSEEVVWNNASNASDMHLLRKNKWQYFESTSQLESLTYASDGSVASRTVTTFDRNGNTVFLQKTVGIVVTYRVRFSYDGQNRLTAQEETVSDGKQTQMLRYEYTHTSRSSAPDMAFYEDGQLRITEVHESNTRVVQTIYFDDVHKIVAVYEDNIKVEEHLLED